MLRYISNLVLTNQESHLSYSCIINQTCGFHEIVEVEAGIIGVIGLIDCNFMSILNSITVHAYLERLDCRAHGAVRSPRDGVGVLAAVEVSSAVSGQ